MSEDERRQMWQEVWSMAHDKGLTYQFYDMVKLAIIRDPLIPRVATTFDNNGVKTIAYSKID